MQITGELPWNKSVPLHHQLYTWNFHMFLYNLWSSSTSSTRALDMNAYVGDAVHDAVMKFLSMQIAKMWTLGYGRDAETGKIVLGKTQEMILTTADLT